MALNHPVMAKNRKVAKLTCKALFLRDKIFYHPRLDIDFTLLIGIFYKNSLLMACSRETHPAIRRPETGGQFAPEEPVSDGPETLARKGLEANKRPVTGGYSARQQQRQIIRGGWRRKQSQANPSPPFSLINREKTGNFDQFRPVLAPDTT